MDVDCSAAVPPPSYSALTSRTAQYTHAGLPSSSAPATSVPPAVAAPITPTPGLVLTVSISHKDVEIMTELAYRTPTLQTGGDLFGTWAGSGVEVTVNLLVGPGLDASVGASHFYQDEHYLQHVGQYAVQTLSLEQIGQWRSHHQSRLQQPSDEDLEAAQRILTTLPRFLMIILNMEWDAVAYSTRPVLRAFLFLHGSPKPFVANISIRPEVPTYACQPQITSIAYAGSVLAAAAPAPEAVVPATALAAPDGIPWFSVNPGLSFIKSLHASLDRGFGNVRMVFRGGQFVFQVAYYGYQYEVFLPLVLTGRDQAVVRALSTRFSNHQMESFSPFPADLSLPHAAGDLCRDLIASIKTAV